MTLEETKAELRSILNDLETGCSNHGCCVRVIRGMGTNSICQCHRHYVQQLEDLWAETADRRVKQAWREETIERGKADDE